MHVLVTGGAGFIGRHLARRLLREGCSVTVLDNFSPQIHGGTQCLPPDLQGKVDLRIGDVRDESAVGRALQGQDVVVHLAAETGTGQSMYEVRRYEDVNVGGTAVLMQSLVSNRERDVRKVILASSRAVYGEGKYFCPTHGVVYPDVRKLDDLLAGRFEPPCPVCGQAGEMQATTEDSPLKPSSFYGLTKQIQEQMVALFSKTVGFTWTALRFQNVYGPGQSLKNPYTGILAIFSNQARADNPINIFEDGLESRDFVYIDDVVEATWRCIRSDVRESGALNVGSGERVTVKRVVDETVRYFSSRSSVTVTGAFRQGDIRHNVADLEKIRRRIGFEPQQHFRDGIRQFLDWASGYELSPNGYELSLNEMRERGLLHG